MNRTYGSYFSCEGDEDFAPYLETALLLKTRIIRVWAGNHGSDDCAPEYRQQVTQKLREAVARAAAKGLIVATEYHPRTLTDHVDSALKLLDDVPGLFTYWQPTTPPPEAAYEAYVLKALGKRVVNIHVFYSTPDRLQAPLIQGRELWLRRLAEIRANCSAVYAAIEYVKGATAQQFLEDAEDLKAFVASVE